MMPGVIDRILAIGKVRPHLVSQIFILGSVRQVQRACPLNTVFTVDLLQERQIRTGRLDNFAYTGQDVLAIGDIEPLVNIVGQYFQSGLGHQREVSPGYFDTFHSNMNYAPYQFTRINS